MKNNDFNPCPNPFADIMFRLDQFECRFDALSKKIDTIVPEKDDEIGNISDCSRWIKKSKSTIYSMVSKRNIPHFKNGQAVRFKKTDIMEWLQKNRIPTISEHITLVDKDLEKKIKK